MFDAPRQPALEVLRAVPSRPRQAPPLLFVHGAFCAAWVWAEHLLPAMAEAGWTAHAVSLRGHGDSAGGEVLRQASLDDYVADVLAAMDDLPAPPVLIGHSMGGMVVQRVIEHFPIADFARAPKVAGAVLMSSVPPGGLWGTLVHMATHDPVLLWQLSAMQAFGHGAATLDGVHRAMFADTASDDLTRRYYGRMQTESWRVQMDLAMLPPPVMVNARSIPMLVVGAEHDSFVPPWMARLTAHAYGADCTILEDAGHAMMLGPAWDRAQAALAGWLDRVGLG
jgi:pimeloyl-ACP methyl ester carboxylesterase